VKDKHKVGGKMARNSLKIAILLLLFVLNQTINSGYKKKKMLVVLKDFFQCQNIAWMDGLLTII
jgi:hypothetical protein